MLKTRNYKMFKFLTANRPINHKIVDELVESLQEKNLLEYRPIMVTENFEILDGQHRYMAAERLGLEIYYQVREKLKNDSMVSEMITLNRVQTRWVYEDYINAYAESGNVHMKKLKDFIKKHNLSVKIGLLYVDTGVVENNLKERITQGTFEFPDDLEEIENNIEFCNHVLGLIHQKTVERFNWKNNKKYISTLIKFLNIGNVEHDLFLHKLKQRTDLLKSCATMLEAMRMWAGIYNWRNKSPVTIDEGDYWKTER